MSAYQQLTLRQRTLVHEMIMMVAGSRLGGPIVGDQNGQLVWYHSRDPIEVDDTDIKVDLSSLLELAAKHQTLVDTKCPPATS